jgi:nitrogen regulatory protein PII
MKEIKAYVRRLVVSEVVRALREAGAPRLTAIDVEGLTAELADDRGQISAEMASSYTPMVKLEIICDDQAVGRFVSIIRDVAHTGRKGDGIIAVSSLDEVRGIRTGEPTG